MLPIVELDKVYKDLSLLFYNYLWIYSRLNEKSCERD